jgi:DNA-binding Lrp family transcriptional regulator
MDLGIGIDPIDVDILREMYRGRKVTPTGIDPRLNVSRIAHRLHTSRSRVAHRLRRWSETGFVSRFDVWPNPALFGLHGWTVDVRSTKRLEKAELFRRFAAADGMVGAQEFVGEWSAVQFVGPDEATGRRRLTLIRGLEGVAEVGEPQAWSPLRPQRSLSSLDVKIARALRKNLGASLAEIAQTVGISSRTMTNRYGRLLDDGAVWFVPLFDFTKIPIPVVALSLFLDVGAPQDRVTRTLTKEYPWVLEFGWAGMRPVTTRNVLVFFVTLPSAAGTEALERFASELPGVREVEALVLVRTHAFSGWADELLARA